jgi:hypothetical protein
MNAMRGSELPPLFGRLEFRSFYGTVPEQDNGDLLTLGESFSEERSGRIHYLRRFFVDVASDCG